MSVKVRRFLVTLVSVLAALAILLSALGVFTARRSFPQVDGEIQLPGLDGEVNIYRDEMGIPQIYAASLHDLFYAQGYVHAQERFWQMDFWRHIGAGRLSEMFGESQLETDAFLRTMGWGSLAEQEFAESGPEAIAILTAYAEGVNAYLADHSGAAVSLEDAILGILTPNYHPEPWTPANTLTWAKAMAWDLRGNLDAEIERTLLMQSFSPSQVADLYPVYPSDHPVIVESYPVDVTDQASTGAPLEAAAQAESALRDAARSLSLLNQVLGPGGSGIGSNSWVISGALTDSGMPLLANDPHLGIQMPSIWFQIGLHCAPKTDACPYEVAGFSFAGVPGVVIGHNDRIAWGFTNNGPDVMDLYIEKVNPENPNQYEVNGAWVAFETRVETIAVGGGDPVEVTVRVSRHGPIITDVYGLQEFGQQAGLETLPENFVIALRWTALQPQHTFDAIWGFNKAQNWEEFQAAARNFNVPAQNLVYADVDGNIGYQNPGLIPVRANGDGTLPVPGWTDDYEWTGYIPFGQLPSAFNPEAGYIVTANNQSSPRDYPYSLTTDWDYGFRAGRIVAMIENAPGPIDIAYIQGMQNDSTSLNAEVMVPLLMSLPMDGRNDEVRQHFLADWDLREESGSQAALVFESFWANLLTATFFDEAFPEEYFPEGGSRFYEVMRNLVDEPDNAWWDDQSTPDVVERRDDIFQRAFAATVTDGDARYGADLSAWPAWGDEHFAVFRNQTLGKSGIGLIESLFNRGPFPTGGGESIVNATGWTLGSGFEVDWLPSMRMIVDLGDLTNSVTVHTTGESGHAYAPHYDDMAPLWASGQYYPMLWDEQAILTAAESHLVLKP